MSDVITTKTDPASAALANLAGELSTLAARASEVSRSIRGLTGPARFSLVAELARSIRTAADGLHEKARSLEEFVKHRA